MSQPTEQTVTVKGHFGDVTLTKKEYIERWKSHAVELYNLVNYDAAPEVGTGYDKVIEMIETIKQMAELKFDAIYKKQQKKGA